MGARRAGRVAAMKLLYALDSRHQLQAAAHGELRIDEELERQFGMLEAAAATDEPGTDGETTDALTLEFAEALCRGVLEELGDIDRRIQHASANWRLDRMSWVDRNILRLATHELQQYPQTPARVVINEAIEIAKRYGSVESAAFVNGVLDRVLRELHD